MIFVCGLSAMRLEGAIFYNKKIKRILPRVSFVWNVVLVFLTLVLKVNYLKITTAKFSNSIKDNIENVVLVNIRA